MALQKDGTVDFGVEADPKDLFGHGNEILDSVEDTGDPEVTPLTELKSIVLSLDWEITDEIMSRFVKEIDKLKDTYRDDEILVSFLGLLDSVGKHIKTHKAKAHPNASKLLNSAYMSLEKVILSKDITEPERNRILASQLKSFKRLMEQIAVRKAASDRKKRLKPPDQARVAPQEPKEDQAIQQKEERSPEEAKERQLEPHEGRVSPDESLRLAVNELKQLVQEEFKALREELRQLRESKERLI
ncbi:MAG: hypothetical protein JSW12_03680 [Deltaproteobacteria bacterium]|nr:MAG: hypothetical protein JSW12_03680 [Deltaproteobacteria bacterium]